MKQDVLEYALQTTVEIPVGKACLTGELWIPTGATGIAIFAHGSGSSRNSPRNRLVAQSLNQWKIGTLLLDLLTEEEEQEDKVTPEHRYDIDLLANRVVAATDWVNKGEGSGALRLGYFCAGTGAAAAIVAANRRPKDVVAIVSRGGRPDLAGFHLKHVLAPTLLIVGSEDKDILRLNRVAYGALKGRKSLHIIPGATHLFEERGALEATVEAAERWFGYFFGYRDNRDEILDGIESA